MNSEFLKHLKSVTPQGKAEEKKMFIPADVIKKEVEDAEELRKLDSIEELDEESKRTMRVAKSWYKAGRPEESHPKSQAYLSSIQRDYRRKRRLDTKKKLEVLQRQLGSISEAEQLIPNAPGQPKKATRKLSYALKNNKNVSPAMVRWTKKGVSHMKRVGKKLDTELDAFKKSRGISEATRSKYLKIYGKHKVGRNEGDIEKADLAREMAMLRRGGATPEQMKAAAEARGRFRRYEKPDPSYNPHDKAMAKYRFANMASRSKAAGKKSPRTVKEAVSTGDPNRGKASRAKPKLPPGQDPYDMYTKGKINPYKGKLQKRLSKMSPEDRKRYYREVGIRSRAASRAGKTGRLFPISESGFKKGIRVAKAVHQKGHFDIAKRDAALTLKALSRVRKTAGMDPRITVPAHKYKPSDAEYAEMQRHAMLARQGKNKKRGITETKAHPVKKSYKRMKKTAKRVLGKMVKILSTPQDNVDFMLTGRKF